MKRILVIEDDGHMRGMLRDMLEIAGYEVLEASNGREGLRLFQRNGVDLVITDIIMPEKEGLETIAEFRRDFPALKIIAISGGGQIDSNKYLRIARIMGAEKIYSKPFRVTELLGGVQELCEGA